MSKQEEFKRLTKVYTKKVLKILNGEEEEEPKEPEEEKKEEGFKCPGRVWEGTECQGGPKCHEQVRIRHEGSYVIVCKTCVLAREAAKRRKKKQEGGGEKKEDGGGDKKKKKAKTDE